MISRFGLQAGIGLASRGAIGAITPPAGNPPVNSVLPAITKNSTTVFVPLVTLTCSQGTWSNSPTAYVYEWLRDGMQISGAIASTYILADADVGAVISCRVTATNADGSNSATSVATVAISQGFKPSQLPGLILWYDGSDLSTITESGGVVSQFNEKYGLYGSGAHLVQGTVGNRPTIGTAFPSPNGRVGIEFLTSRYLISGAVDIPATEHSSFLTGFYRNSGSGNRFFTWARAGNADNVANGTIIHYRSTAGQQISVYGGTGAASSPIIYGVWFLHSATRLTAEVRSAVNGGTDVSTTVSVTAPFGPLIKLAIGCGLNSAHAASAGSLDGVYGELFAYNRVVSSVEKAICEGYGAWGWGLQSLLPAGHAYKNNPPLAVLPPVNIVAPEVTGNTYVGQTLTTTNGTWGNSPTGYTYQWKRDGVNIASATNNTYVLVSADIGASVLCAVTATNLGGPVAANSNTISSITLYGVPTTPTPRTAGQSSTITTPAFNPPASGMLFVGVTARLNATFAAITLSNNSGLVMNMIADLSYDGGSGTRIRRRAYAVPIGSSPPTEVTFTTTASGSTRMTINFMFVPGMTTVPTASQVASNFSIIGDPSCAFDHVPAINSVLLSMFSGANSAGINTTPLSGFTELEDLYDAIGQTQEQTGYKMNNGAQVNTWTETTVATWGVVIEAA